jgi:hypothetical protein
MGEWIMKSILFIGIILAWLGSLVYVGNYQYQAGSIAKNAEWQEKENKELKALLDVADHFRSGSGRQCDDGNSRE